MHSLAKSSRLLTLIKKSIAVKLFYTERDFKDNKIRQILNAGHTIGHAIELKYKIPHGKAIILGFIKELEFTQSLNLSNNSIRINLLNLLNQLGIEVNMKMKANWSAIKHDKKIIGKNILFPVIEKEGKSKLIKIDLELLRKFNL